MYRCQSRTAYLLVTLGYLTSFVSTERYLTVSPPAITDVPETVSKSVELKFLNCSDEGLHYYDVSITLIEGWERNLDFPSTVNNVPCVTDPDGVGVNFTITGQMIGFVMLEFKDSQTDEHLQDIDIGIIRPPEQLLDDIYLYGIMIFVVVNTFCFGVSLDLTKVKEFLKKPIAPCIGMGCQYLVLPLIGFLAASLITNHNAEKFGIFASAVAPGGGLSNIWTFALLGDLDLSITMTAISTVAALAFVPLWMYTLGEYMLRKGEEDSELTLPFQNMAITLALLVVPLTIGILANKFFPKFGKQVLKWIQKPSMALTIIFGVVMNVWANLYAFKLVLFDWQLAVCTFLIPYAGGLISFFIGLLLRQNRKIAMTIGIEVAIQNTNISTILLRTSLPQPWADISSAIPISMIIFTFTPFPFIMAAQQIYLRCIKKREKDDQCSELESNNSHKLERKQKQGQDNPIPVTDDIDM